MARRYLLVRLVTESPISEEQFHSALVDSIRGSFGEFGLARIAPKLIKFDATRSEAIVGCSEDGTEDLQASIGLIPDSQETTITAITLRVSGTLKGLRRKQRF